MAVLVVWFFRQNEKYAPGNRDLPHRSQALVSRTSGSVLLAPHEESGEEKEERDGADDEADKEHHLHAEGNTRICEYSSEYFP